MHRIRTTNLVQNRIPSNPTPAATCGAASELRLDLTDATGRVGSADAERLLDLLSRCIALACRREAHRTRGQVRTGGVRVRIVNDAEMSLLHEEYSGIAGTTDVLTFDMSDEPDARGVALLDVDITVCLDEAERQGARRGHAAIEELLLYSLHGVLHCLGHDDHDDLAYAAMHAAEDEILAQVGTGVRFHGPDQGTEGGGTP